MNKLILSLSFVLIYTSFFTQNQITFDILTDEYSQETAWEIIDNATSSVVAGEDTYPTDEMTYPTDTINLPNGNYTFNITDSADDGICCGYGIGVYTLTDITTGIVIISGGDFGSGESISFALPFVPPVMGCTNSDAYNYNSDAESDDGSCLFLNSQLEIDLEQVAAGFSSVVDITNAGDDRLFLVEQSGQIIILDPVTGVVNPTDFIDISSNIQSGGEQGLLGLAFHPDYANNGYFYVNYTKNNGDSRISRFTVTADPNIADPASEVIILEQDQPFGNHNAGDLNFGPDGYLYIPFGDGGSGGDPQNNSQSGDTWLGKMLRIDINGTAQGNYSIPADNPYLDDNTVLDEIWAVGLRNTWRFSFDAETGDMWMGDVGQNQLEEIDFEPADSEGGLNYGWRCYEASDEYDTSQCGDVPVEDLTMPIYEYSHAGGACSVTGGYVYRGTEFPAMVGKYFFVDYCAGVFKSLEQVDGEFVAYDFAGDFGNFFTTFGEGNDNSIYVCGAFGGTVYKLVDPCIDFQVTITTEDNGDLTATEGTEYIWLINGDVTDNVGQTLTDIDLANNTYQVSVTNAEGCAQVSEVINSVGIEGLNGDKIISIYPNPVSGKLNFEQNYFTNNFKVSITDMNGNVVLIESNKVNVDVSAISAGNYILVITDGKESIMKSFVKK